MTWNTAPGVSPSGTTATNRFVLGAREPPAPPLLLLLLPAPPLLAPWFRPSETAAAADLAAAKDADEDAGNDPAAAAADAADASEAMDEEEAAVEGAGSGVCDTSWPARSMEVIKYLAHREGARAEAGIQTQRKRILPSHRHKPQAKRYIVFRAH